MYEPHPASMVLQNVSVATFAQLDSSTGQFSCSTDVPVLPPPVVILGSLAIPFVIAGIKLLFSASFILDLKSWEHPP